MNPTISQVFNSMPYYQKVLKAKADSVKTSKDLVKLDEWFRGQLRDQVAKRKDEKDHPGGYLEKEDLEKLMTWKLAVSSDAKEKLERRASENREKRSGCFFTNEVCFFLPFFVYSHSISMSLPFRSPLDLNFCPISDFLIPHALFRKESFDPLYLR